MDKLIKIKGQISLFLQSKDINLWLKGSGIEVYVRKGYHLIDGKRCKTLDIANITVTKKGQGLGSEFLEFCCKINPFDAVYIENILNNRFFVFLIKNDWQPVHSIPPSVYKFTGGE